MSYMNKIVIFTPGCLLCPIYQAEATDKNFEWANAIRLLLFEKNANIIQMPCPEVSFNRYSKGLKRKPHGLKYYAELESFEKYCEILAQKVVQQIIEIQSAGYDIRVIIGIEHSPTCAVSYIYTNKGTIHCKGIFYQKISDLLMQKQIHLTFLGINRRFFQKSVKRLKEILERT